MKKISTNVINRIPSIITNNVLRKKVSGTILLIGGIILSKVVGNINKKKKADVSKNQKK